MDLSELWSEEAYTAMQRVLRKWFGDVDLVYEAAAERWLEIREMAGPPPKSAAELIGLCLKHVKHRALDVLRKQRGLKQRWAPLDEAADRALDLGQREIWVLLQTQERCLYRMAPRQRELLQLYYYQGLSDRAIASRRLQRACPGDVPRGASDSDKALTAEEGRRAIEAARKDVSRQRRAALECLRRLIEAELAREESAVA